jgi:hypothetical protein
LKRIRPDSKLCITKRQDTYDDAVLDLYEAKLVFGDQEVLGLSTNEKEAVREAYIKALETLDPCPVKKRIYIT